MRKNKRGPYITISTSTMANSAIRMCIYTSLLVCVRIGSFDTGTYHFIRKHYNQVRTYFYMLYRNIHTYVVIYIKSIYEQHTHKHTYTRHTEKTQIIKKHKYTHTHIQKVHAHKKTNTYI